MASLITNTALAVNPLYWQTTSVTLGYKLLLVSVHLNTYKTPVAFSLEMRHLSHFSWYLYAQASKEIASYCRLEKKLRHGLYNFLSRFDINNFS